MPGSPRPAIRRAALAFLLGAATVPGFAPLGWFVLPLLSLAGLFALWAAKVSRRDTALTGFAFGLGLMLAGVSWIYVSLSEFGGMPMALAALATLIFCGLMALYYAAAGWVWARLRSGATGCDSLLAAACWTLAEWLRGWLLGGFPWLVLGYSQSPPSPLAGWAPLLGVYGLSFLLAWMAALLGFSWQRRGEGGWRRAATALVVVPVLGFTLTTVTWTQPRPDALSISLLQGNIGQSLKWRPERVEQSLDTYLELARKHPARLVVLPETALPVRLDAIDPDYFDDLRGGRESDSAVLLGAVVVDAPGRYFNSAVAFNREGRQDYRKSHLVPFGEFTPPGFDWTLKLLHIPMSDFSAGPALQAPMNLAGEKIAISICYEDVFGEAMIRVLPEATLLVNLSNVAWFGDSLAPAQHLQIAQLRALETGRSTLRATNTGKTAVVAADGSVTSVLPAFQTAALIAQVRGYTGLTPYARWGNWPVVSGAVLLLAGLAWLRRRADGPARGGRIG